MTTKFISLATGIVLLDVYLRSQLYSNDPLFLFASSNLVVNAGLLILSGLMVAASFKSRFERWWSFAGCALLALVLGAAGFMGLFYSNLLHFFSDVLLPLDYMFLLEAGVVFGICALSYEHQKLPLKLALSSPAAWVSKFAFPVPKIPHSPNILNRNSAPSGTR